MKTRVFRRHVSLLECAYPNVILFLTHEFMNETNHVSFSENSPNYHPPIGDLAGSCLISEVVHHPL